MAVALMLGIGTRTATAQVTRLITGRIRVPNGINIISNGTMAFTLSQAAIIAGVSTIAPQTVYCYTDTGGLLVGLPNPTAAPVAAVAGGGSLTSNVYYIVITYYGAGTQTVVSPETTVTLTNPPNSAITITAPIVQPATATGYKIYMSTSPGAETLQATSSGWPSTTITSLVSGAAMPSSNDTSCELYFNDQLTSPSDTTYIVGLNDANGTKVAGFPQEWYLAGSSIDISNLYPLAAVSRRARFPSPLLSNPTSNAQQSVASPVTLNGYPLTAGSILLPNNSSPPTPAVGRSTIYTDSNGALNICSGLSCFKPLNCAAYAGVSADARINRCLADVSATGGTADATGIQGAQTLSAQIVVAANKTLLLGAATFTCNFAGIAFNMSGANGRLIGLNRDSTTLAQDSTCAPFSAVLIAADGVTISNFGISGIVPAGSEAGPLSAVTLSKSASTLNDVTIDQLYITGTNGGIYADQLIPHGVNHLRVLNNRIRTLHYGIVISPFEYGIVDNDVLIQDNDVEVSAIGNYPAVEFARSITAFNGNGTKILHNRAMGGFNGIEVLGNIGNPSTGRPHMHGVIVAGNTIDSSPTIAQTDGGVFIGNVIDMTLRNGSWPTYDLAAVVASSGHRPGLEASDNNNLVVSSNFIGGANGLGADWGANNDSSFIGNTVYNAGTGSSLAAYEGSCLELTYTAHHVTIAGNTFDTCTLRGINQTVRESFSVINDITISNNIIRNTGEHGMHFHNVGVEGIVVSSNSVSNVSLAAANTYDGINFSIDGGVGAIQGLTVTNNITSTGRYGIANTYVDSAANRLEIFEGNIANSATTAGFNIYGHTAHNWDSAWTTGTTHALSAGALDARTAEDQINLAGASTLSKINNGTLGKILTIAFNGAANTVINSGNLLLNGGLNAAVPINSIMTFICLADATATNELWIETSRNFYDTLEVNGNVVFADMTKGISWSGGPSISQGTGAPIGACGTSSLYLRNDGGAGTSLYVCESGTWVGK